MAALVLCVDELVSGVSGRWGQDGHGGEMPRTDSTRFSPQHPVGGHGVSRSDSSLFHSVGGNTTCSCWYLQGTFVYIAENEQSCIIVGLGRTSGCVVQFCECLMDTQEL